MSLFKLESDFSPAGHQPDAIAALTKNIADGARHQTLLGVTGSGKTFVMANLIAATEKPTLILSHNKTLTAQLFGEFRQFFPHNAVEYFVSYYDYYQPEAYIAQTDVYIEKDSAVNEDLDRLRLSSTSALLTRRDTVVVASVSSIYGLGQPEDYKNIALGLQVGEEISYQGLLTRLVEMQYDRNDIAFKRGTFRVRGDAFEIWPAYQQTAIRVELFGDELEDILEIVPLTGEVVKRYQHLAIFPATHFMLSEGAAERAMVSIEAELDTRLEELRGANKILEAQRLESRTRYDLEMIEEIGYCQGIENYSRHFDGREPGSRPACLFDYFPKDDWLLIVDESHVTLPQVRGMYNGDRSRKQNLVEHGFRLPSALDNRPLKWNEFTTVQPQSVYVSATPAPYEIEKSSEHIIELIVRPTGLVDPPIEVRPTTGQVQDVVREIEARSARGERVLVTTLTKRLSEDLDGYCREQGLKTMYLHSDVETIERVEILKDLRLGKYDALIGVNLLREGLDLPEVSLVIVLDADKQGFLRSATALIQTIGRCARNTAGRVIFYGDKITDAMQQTMDETSRRREMQLAYNKEHHITPTSTERRLETGMEEFFTSDEKDDVYIPALGKDISTAAGLEEEIKLVQAEMIKAAAELRYEDASALRDRLIKLGAKIEFVAEEAAPYGRSKTGRNRNRNKSKTGRRNKARRN